MAQAWCNHLVRELIAFFIEPYGKALPGTGGVLPVLNGTGGFPKIGNRAFVLEVIGIEPSRAEPSQPCRPLTWISPSGSSDQPGLRRRSTRIGCSKRAPCPFSKRAKVDRTRACTSSDSTWLE